ncbi:hypothetical protein TCAL_01726 [Tigriopus californicus]|uniref:Vesicle tethering protein Uso1/P115-like head domain-containing protein n=1 Tax=Tigriopus californicus TaxID=6832 RepID=A0A553PMN7_TIGCA|nr:general vesicular transport factor p115-like [Tigriopus californicus]TRY78930.1 hypothetical protein TCAL_01726 [Tigriopus californicus]|eukprot:TCALIF_01726-PA protein Name:"Similar to Uso1 General vesicular transport factor p115 (Mus musculus)" AED:0.01 eAED:0.01 QI:0/-1/0/1/-1/1/1/0/893
MDLFRSVLGGVGGGSGVAPGAPGGPPSSADTIERLVDRLSSSTLLEDRRDACRALKAMSRKFRVEVGVQALSALVEILAHGDGQSYDEEMLSYALDTLCNICSPDEFEEEVGRAAEREPAEGVGEQFTEIYLKQAVNVQYALDALGEFDFRIRRPAVRLLTHLLFNKPRQMQDLILASHMGVSRLMDVLVDNREVLRNDALLLLIQLTKGNANLQKIVAFENCFDKLIDILNMEGLSDGGIVVEDCLRLMLNLLRNNASNQTFFREGSFIQRITPFFDLTLEPEEIEVGWSAQKVSNMLHMLLVVRTLVSPANPSHVTTSCQRTVHQCGLLEKLCSILMAAGIPSDILTEAINAIAESIRGCAANQDFFALVQAPATPPRPALILLLMSMVNEKQPFALRCAVLYCFQCYVHKNSNRQNEIMRTLLPANQPANNEITAGQLLCGGLFSNDRLSNWFSSVALAHGLVDQESIKLELLRVQLSTAKGTEPVSMISQCCYILQQSSQIQTRLGILMLVSTWIHNCIPAVTTLLAIPEVVPFLTGQIGSNEHDDLERLGQGLCAFVLGLCILDNDNSVANNTQDDLYQLIEKRIGGEVFLDKLGEISKHESYNRALKHPQPKCVDSKDLLFDHHFCLQFKHLEHSIISFLHRKKENDPLVETTENNAALVQQFKELIREQDQRINDLTKANIYLQSELTTAKHQVDDLITSLATLKDQNSVLRAQSSHTKAAIPTSEVINTSTSRNGPSTGSQNANFAEEKRKLEHEVKIRDDIIQELEMRLMTVENDHSTSGDPKPLTNGHGSEVEAEMALLKTQLESLRVNLSQKEEDIHDLKSQRAPPPSIPIASKELEAMKLDVETLKAEQDDLLVLLADQDTQLVAYRAQLRALGQVVDEDD